MLITQVQRPLRELHTIQMASNFLLHVTFSIDYFIDIKDFSWINFLFQFFHVMKICAAGETENGLHYQDFSIQTDKV